MRHLTLALALSVAVAGCATKLPDNQTRIVVSSNPAGAIIKFRNKGGEVISQKSPATIVWTHQPGSYIDTGFIGAAWPSGATTTMRLNLYAGQDGVYEIQRPNVPGLDRDLQYASASRDGSADEAVFLLQAATVTMDAYSQSKKSTTMKAANCTSTKVLDGTVVTNCTESAW